MAENSAARVPTADAQHAAPGGSCLPAASVHRAEAQERWTACHGRGMHTLVAPSPAHWMAMLMAVWLDFILGCLMAVHEDLPPGRDHM